MPSSLLTNSRLRSLRNCPREHAYQYQDGFRPAREPEYLTFGTLVHKAIEHAILGKPFTYPDDLSGVIAEELVRGYFERWGAFQDVLGVEIQFEIPLPDPALIHDHATFRLAGKLDVITGTRAAAVLWDHKTTSRPIDPASLILDSQISQYFLGANALGFNPVKWIHDVIRKPEIDLLKATPTEKRKYTKEGRLYANQRAEDETVEEFRLRLRSHIAEKPDWYFQRIEVPRIESQIAAHLQNIWHWLPHLESRAQNPDACTRYGRCPFFDACSVGTHPREMPTVFVASDPHPELQGVSP